MAKSMQAWLVGAVLLFIASLGEATEDETPRQNADLLRRRASNAIPISDHFIRDLPRMDQHLLDESEGFWGRNLGAFGSTGSTSMKPTRNLRSNDDKPDRLNSAATIKRQGGVQEQAFLDYALDEDSAFWIRSLQDESSMSMEIRRELQMSMSMNARFL